MWSTYQIWCHLRYQSIFSYMMSTFFLYGPVNDVGHFCDGTQVGSVFFLQKGTYIGMISCVCMCVCVINACASNYYTSDWHCAYLCKCETKRKRRGYEAICVAVMEVTWSLDNSLRARSLLIMVLRSNGFNKLSYLCRILSTFQNAAVGKPTPGCKVRKKCTFKFRDGR